MQVCSVCHIRPSILTVHLETGAEVRWCLVCIRRVYRAGSARIGRAS